MRAPSTLTAASMITSAAISSYRISDAQRTLRQIVSRWLNAQTYSGKSRTSNDEPAGRTTEKKNAGYLQSGQVVWRQGAFRV